MCVLQHRHDNSRKKREEADAKRKMANLSSSLLLSSSPPSLCKLRFSPPTTHFISFSPRTSLSSSTISPAMILSLPVKHRNSLQGDGLRHETEVLHARRERRSRQDQLRCFFSCEVRQQRTPDSPCVHRSSTLT